jgi:hypothetical protein
MLTAEYIQSVVESDNLVVRNLQVTQGYYRLSQGMKRYMSDINVNWCAFATHASKTAGQALRHELMPGFLRSVMIRRAGFDNTFVFFSEGLGDQKDPAMEEHDSRVGEALLKMSELVSDGNITVFEELAWPFAGYIESFRKDWVRDEGKLQAFLDEYLQPGPLSEGGQDYLREAFTAYYDARFETNAKKKAELVLIGNLLVGLHEQTRLQPQIEQSMAVPIDMFSNSSKGSAEKNSGTGGAISGRQAAATRKIIAKAITQMMMLITLPSRQLKLSQNVIAPTGVINYPQDLIKIENPRCLELVRMFEMGNDTLTGSAADDWSSLDERMSFVVDFFRSHQQYERMWESPFREEQAQVIESGHFPAGPL